MMMGRRLSRWLLLTALVIVTQGCSIHYAGYVTPRYKHSGQLKDLFLERTVEPGDVQTPFAGPYNNRDGHGVYDVPVVFLEHVVLSPAEVLEYPLWVLSYGGGLFIPAQNDIVAGAMSVQSAVVFWGIWLPLIAYQDASVTTVDLLIHDLPVLLVGKPVKYAFGIRDDPADRDILGGVYVIEGPYYPDAED